MEGESFELQGEVVVPSAREIKSRLDKRDAEVRRRRADAVLAVGVAGGAAVRARERYEAALRVKFEAALRTREDSDRAAELRAAFEAALVDSTEVWEAEVAAGRAVVDASALRVSQAELTEVTELRVEDLRRWAQLARQETHETIRKASGREELEEMVARRETGYAVVAAPESQVAERADPAGPAGGVTSSLTRTERSELGSARIGPSCWKPRMRQIVSGRQAWLEPCGGWVALDASSNVDLHLVRELTDLPMACAGVLVVGALVFVRGRGGCVALVGARCAELCAPHKGGSLSR